MDAFKFGPDLNSYEPIPIVKSRRPFVSNRNDRVITGDIYYKQNGYLNCFECDIFQIIPTINYDTIQVVSRGSGPHALRYVFNEPTSDISGNTRILPGGIPTNIFDDWVTPNNSLGYYNNTHINVPFGNIPFYIHSLGSTTGIIYLNVQLFNLGRRSDRVCIVGGGSSGATGGGGTIASINPVDISGLQLRLNAFAGISGLSNNSLVSQIIDTGDFSGRNALQANSAKRATYSVPGAPNGRPGLLTDGTKKYVGAMPATGPSNAAGMTFYAFISPSSLVGLQTLFESQDEGSPSLYVGANVGWSDALGAHNIGSGQIASQVIVWNFAPPNDGTGICRVYRGSTLLGSANWKPASATFNNAYYYLTDEFEISGFIGYANELMFFNSSHDATTQAGITQFVSDYWTM